MIELRATPAPLPRVAGWAAFGVLAVFVVAGLVRRLPDDPALASSAAAAALGFGAVAVLGRRLLILPAAALASVGVVIIGNGTASNLAWFGLGILAAWCSLCAPLLVTAIYGSGAMLLLVGEVVFTSHDPGWAAWIGGTCFSIVGCLFGRRQHDLVGQLRAAQSGLAARAQAEERNRIARELHDVIAHSLTVSLLHVSSARLALDEDHDEAVRALDEAERLGRASLDEVRHAVGMLRREGESDPSAPLPGSLDVPTLIERFRAAGARVESTVDGDLGGLPGTVGLATYRILQEALTNAVKHAPDATSTVQLAVDQNAVRLSVDTAGRPGHGTGLGLLGMRERAESLGGRCTAGPGGRGWLVSAELPCARSRS